MTWTWKDELIEVLLELGGEAQLTDIYVRVKKRGKKKLTPNYKATIRGTLESYCPQKKFDRGIPIFNHMAGTGDNLGGERSGRYSLIYNSEDMSIISFSDNKGRVSVDEPNADIDSVEFFDISDAGAIEGYFSDQTYLYKARNRNIVNNRKAQDDFTCQACGFRLRIAGKYIIECHHIVPFSDKGERVTSLEDLVSLCPTCHRIVHTRNPPYSVQEVKVLLKLTKA